MEEFNVSESETEETRQVAIRNMLDVYLTKTAEAMDLDENQTILLRQGFEALMLRPPTARRTRTHRNPRSRYPRYPELFREEIDGTGISRLYDWNVYAHAVSDVEFDLINGEAHAYGHMFGQLSWTLNGPAAASFQAWWGGESD